MRNLATDQARARARVSVEPWADVPDAIAVELAPDAIVLRADDRRRSRVPRSPTSPPVHQRGAAACGSSRSSTTTAVAERLDTTEHAARQRVYRAMQALRVTRAAPATRSATLS